MDDDEIRQWEEILMLSYQNDQSLIEASTNEINNVLQTNECVDIFIWILMQSHEAIVRNAASIYLFKAIKLRIRMIPIKKRMKICSFILDCIGGNDINDVILGNFIGVISLMAEKMHKLFPEVEHFIDEIEHDSNLVRLLLLVNVLPFLKNDYIEPRYLLFSNIAVNLLMIDNWEMIFNAIKLIKILLNASKNLSGFEKAFDRIGQLCYAILNENETSQNKFWNEIGELINVGVFPNDFIDTIVNSISSENMIPDVTITALIAIQPVIKLLSQEKALEIVNISIKNGIKYTEEEQYLSEDVIAPIVNVFNYFSHKVVYQLVKSRVSEIISNNLNAGAIYLLNSVLSAAVEQITDDKEFLFTILKVGLSSNDSFVIQACFSLIENFEDVDEFTIYYNELIEMIYPYLIVNDTDLKHGAFESIKILLSNQYIKGSFEKLWEIKDKISNENQYQYMDILGLAIHEETILDDEKIGKIIQFASSFILNMDDLLLTSSSFYILSKLLMHDETAIMDVIDDNKEGLSLCLHSGNEEIQYKALAFLNALLSVCGEKAFSFVSKFNEEISSFMHASKLNSNLRNQTLMIASKIAKFGNQSELIETIIQTFQNLIENDFIDVVIACINNIIPVLSNNQSLDLFNFVVDTCKNTDDEDTAMNCFIDLKKFLKHCKQENAQHFYQTSFELCQEFMHGDLPFLNQKSILNLENDIQYSLLESFFDFVSRILSVPSAISWTLCEECLKLFERPQEIYHIVVFQVFLDAIEIIDQEILQTVISYIPQFIQTKDPSFRGNIVFFMILLLKKYPPFYESLKSLLPILIEWWDYSTANIENSNSNYLVSNIASLFMLIATIDSQFPQNVLEKTLDFFPPNDYTETTNMSMCILKLFSNYENLELNTAIKVAIAIGKLLSLQQNKIDKCKIPDNILQNLISLLKGLCQNESIMKSLISSLSNKKSCLNRLMALLQ